MASSSIQPPLHYNGGEGGGRGKRTRTSSSSSFLSIRTFFPFGSAHTLTGSPCIVPLFLLLLSSVRALTKLEAWLLAACDDPVIGESRGGRRRRTAAQSRRGVMTEILKKKVRSRGREQKNNNSNKARTNHHQRLWKGRRGEGRRGGTPESWELNASRLYSIGIRGSKSGRKKPTVKLRCTKVSVW